MSPEFHLVLGARVSKCLLLVMFCFMVTCLKVEHGAQARVFA